MDDTRFYPDEYICPNCAAVIDPDGQCPECEAYYEDADLSLKYEADTGD